jgi:peptidoglycan-N-acetylglucosamine deacetylase
MTGQWRAPCGRHTLATVVEAWQERVIHADRGVSPYAAGSRTPPYGGNEVRMTVSAQWLWAPRAGVAAVVLAAWLASGASDVAAQRGPGGRVPAERSQDDASEPSPQAGRRVAPSLAPVRCDPSRSLGVSRILEIGTETGPRFGHVQYKDHAPLQDGEVILTFDDGPLRANTQGVLDALEAQCTKATFFMVGSQALADPDMVKRIQVRGHTVGNHTWSHSDLRKMTPQMARREIELGFSAVTLAAGQPIAPFFRFPFLSDTSAMKQMAETRGYGVFSIDIDALDYRNKNNPEAVHAEVMKQLQYQRKGILLFHDIHPATAQALPGILADLKRRNFRVVHVRPTTAYVTLPEFDAMARKEFGAKRTAVANNPLAPRAVTFPLPSKESVPGAFPPVQPGAQPATPPQLAQPLPRVTRPLPPPPPRDDWRRGLFN